jgi:signal transduction histidine kinase
MMYPLSKNAPGIALWLLGLFSTLLVGYVDWVTGPEINLTIFYLIPVAVVAWYGGKRAGLWLTGPAAVIQLIAGLAAPYFSSVGIAFWNMLANLIALWLAILLLSKVKAMSRQMERKVEERTAELSAEVAERRRAEEAMRTLAAQLSEAEDAERTRLAADIHDSVGQALSVLKMNLGSFANSVPTAAKACGGLSDSLRLIDDIIRQTRTFMFDLHPAMLEDLGLVPTLHWYADHFGSQAGTQVGVSESGEPQTLSAPSATYLFRAIKELLNNAVKHGKAREVVVAVHWRPTPAAAGVRVVIDDDGSGFDPVAALAPHTRRGLGLPSIRERLSALGGQLTIESQPGHGARVILEIARPAA